MTGQVTIYGASDDLVEVEGQVAGCDEYPTDNAQFILVGASGKTRVHVFYNSVGLWEISAGPLAEDIPMLPLAINSGEKGYTALAVIEDVELVIHEMSA